MSDATPCPDDATLTLFAEGAVPPGLAEVLGHHSESCEACRRMLAALAKLRSSRDAADPPAPAEPDAMPAAVGRYEVRRRVGAGAFGVVYEAFDPALQRQVAVKLLRRATDGAWLQREGQVMARLSHRHVAVVHDVGTHAGRAWVAMEFVDGLTLRQWLAAARRSPEAVLRVLRDAGAGLAAAHAQGLVHRDLKPDNVLVEQGGRAVVTDFGLAGSGGEPPSGPQAPASPLLSRTGAIVGTPAYMALEQLEGGPADARSDQFAFCVTCVEALAGRRPVDAKDLDALKVALREGRLDAAALAAVPARVRRVLARGLSSRPEARYPSMEALLAALAPPSRARPLLVAGGAVVLAALASGGWAFSRARVCQGAGERLAEAWDPRAREAVRAAFLATRLPWAEAAAQGFGASLDVWAKAWAAAYTDACEATRVRGAQSEELLDLRMSCLAERLAEAKSLTRLLASADQATLEASSRAVQRLSPLSACADEKALRAPVRPPADAQTAARVDAARQALAGVVAARAAGQYQPARQRLDAVMPGVTALAFHPLEAEAWVLRAQLEEDVDDFEGAAGSLQRALVAAEAGGHLTVTAQAWALLVRVEGHKRAKYAEAHRAAELAGAAVERLGHPPALSALLARTLGDVLSEEGKHAEAKAQYEQALALNEAVDPGGVQVAASLTALGDEARALGDSKAAAALFERARALLVARLGPTHPDVAQVQKDLGNVSWDQSRLDEALSWYQQALALQQAALGDDSLEVASTRNNVASVYLRQQKLDEAEAALRGVIAVMEKKLGPEHPRLYGELNNLAVVLRYKQQAPQAEAALRRALAIAEQAHGPDSDDVATTLVNLGDLQLSTRDFAGSAASYQRAVAITLKTQGPAHPALAECYGGLAFPLLELREYRRALEAADRSLAIFAQAPGIPLVEAQVHFAHGRAQWELEPTHRAAAAQEVRAARATMQHAGAQASDLAELDQWLGAHVR